MESWKVNLTDIPETHHTWNWKEGSYERYRQQISVALGNTRENRHPFDVEISRLPPGAKPCPIHSHTQMWEMFIIISGRAIVQRNGKSFEAGAGDCILQPAGTLHRIGNASDTEDLVYYLIANEPAGKDSGGPVEI